MKKYLVLFIAMSLLGACSQYDEPAPTLQSAQPASTNIHTIPLDSALSYLEMFMASDEDEGSRSGQKRTVSSIKNVSYDLVASRSGNDSADCKNLLYIANFANNEGYAVLAADNRLPERVIAITDKGNISDRMIVEAGERTLGQKRPIFEDYPTTGPGFLTLPEYGDELFMNPNTADLYIESENDTLVGNYTLDSDERVVNYLPDFEPESSNEDLPFVTVVDYAIDEFNNSGNRLGNDSREDYTAITGPRGEPGRVEETKEVTYHNKSEILLRQFVGWHQDSPFNDLYPTRRMLFLFGRKKTASAGCFPLAIAKVLTYFELPQASHYKNNHIDLKELKKDFNSPIGKRAAALLLKKICDGCDCWCLYQGTFTFPHKAADFMKSLGFQNVKSYEFTFQRAVDMIDKGNPVIISSIPQHYNIFKSHCWNIDGYKIKKTRIKRDWYQGTKLVHSETKVHNIEMVHCDFGWGGYHNGYYVAGVFKLVYEDNELDYPYLIDKNKDHYKHNNKVILYDLR